MPGVVEGCDHGVFGVKVGKYQMICQGNQYPYNLFAIFNSNSQPRVALWVMCPKGALKGEKVRGARC